MSKKYVIEMKSEYEDTIRGIMVLGARDSNLYTDALAVEDMEELNSDYINEHFGDLQDTAYQRGLDDAWEAARKVIHLPEGVVLDLFTDCYSSVCTVLQVFLKYEGSEVIEKLKAYEEKQKADDEIKVGDEVKHKEYKNRFVVTKMQDEHVYGISKDGSWNNFRNDGSIVKTGRHFDIESILEAMKE